MTMAVCAAISAVIILALFIGAIRLDYTATHRKGARK